MQELQQYIRNAYLYHTSSPSIKLNAVITFEVVILIGTINLHGHRRDINILRAHAKTTFELINLVEEITDRVATAIVCIS